MDADCSIPNFLVLVHLAICIIAIGLHCLLSVYRQGQMESWQFISVYQLTPFYFCGRCSWSL